MDAHVAIDAPPQPRLLLGEAAAKIAYAAAELGLPDLLGNEPAATPGLAAATGTHEPSLRRLLRALAGLGLVAQTDHDRFELTELGEPLRSGVPGSQRELLTMLCGSEVWRSWEELVPSVRSGETGWERAHGMSWVEFYERHPERAANFNRAMSEHTRDAAPAIVAAAELSRFDTVVDVGGGDGTLLAAALRSAPDLRGVLFDLPSGLEGATASFPPDLNGRCTVVPGDFFASVPEGGDAYVLKQVLHDWDDDEAVAILRSVRAAVRPGGRVLIVERVLPELVGQADVQELLVDVLMMVVTGGRERTEAEFRGLVERAGFELRHVSAALRPFGYRVLETAPRT